jgi:hypothetical protein
VVARIPDYRENRGADASHNIWRFTQCAGPQTRCITDRLSLCLESDYAKRVGVVIASAAKQSHGVGESALEIASSLCSSQ